MRVKTTTKMFKAMCLTVFLAILVVDYAHCYHNVSGGAHVRISNRGLDTVKSMGKRILEKELSNKRFKSFYGSTGDLHYAARNIYLDRVNIDSYNIKNNFEYGYVILNVGLSVSAGARLSAYYNNGWFKFGDATHAEVYGHGINITLAIQIDVSGGNISVNNYHCKTRIEDIKFKFRGGHTWLYRLVSFMFKDVISNKLEEAICDAGKEIDINKITNPNMVIDLGGRKQLDLSILDVFYDHYKGLDLVLKGEGQIKYYPSFNRYVRPPAYDTRYTSHNKDINIWISRYMLDTVARSYHYDGKLNQLVSGLAYMVPDNFTNTQDYYHVFPRYLYEKFPNTSIRYDYVSVPDAPTFDIESSYYRNVVNVNVSLSYYMIMKNRYYLNVRLDTPFVISLYYDHYRGAFRLNTWTNYGYNATLSGSSVDGYRMNFNNDVMFSLYYDHLMPYVKDQLRNITIKMPSVGGMKLSSPTLRTQHDAIRVDAYLSHD